MKESARSLRTGLEEIRRTLARLPDPPEPLTAGELARRASPRRGRVPAAAPTAAPGSLVAAVGALRSGALSAAELVQEALERAEAERELGAFVLLRPEAVEEARRADALRRRQGAAVGGRPLLGVPLSVKDIVDVEGLTTTSGSRFPRRAVRTAPAWKALADAGAILMGKNNLQEFAFGVNGDNPTFGRTRNPRDPARISGGSSSGSAAATAAGIGYGSLGTDTGGSIRIPAALTGVFGLKPTYGRVSSAGITPLSWSLDHVGPIARTAADIALLFEALSGPEGSAAPASGSKPLAGVRFGVPRDFFYTDLTPEAHRAADGVAAALAGLGAEAVPVEIPEVELSAVCRTVAAFAEAAAVHRERLADRPDDFSEEVRVLLEAGRELSAGDYLVALSGRRLVADAFARLFEQVEALVVPTIPAGAPRAGEARLATGEDLRTGLIRLVGPFNFAGLPALQIPAGFDSNGMPLGVQLVAGPAKDGAAIRLACHLETDGALPRPA